MKIKIKVEYDLKTVKPKKVRDLDKIITEKIESIDGVWYAQGTNLETNIRDICFDLQIA